MVLLLPSFKQVLLYKSYLLQQLSALANPWLSGRADNKPPRALFTKPNNLWPCGTRDKPSVLHYSFFQSANNVIQRNRESKIQAVMMHIEKHVPGIKFVQVLNDSDAAIRIAFDHEHPYGKTWSRVGREAEKVSFKEPTMNLSDVTGHESGEFQVGSKEYGGIVHELLHALGMQHEHQHPDRPFDISTIAVVSDMKDDGWSKKDTINNIVKRFNPSAIGAFSPPDMTSCMNYRIHSKWTRDGTEVKKNNKPSDLDFVWLNLMYPPPDLTKFEQALSKSMDSRISKDHRASIMELYLDGEWERVRSKIASVSNPKSKSSESKKGVVGKMLIKLKLAERHLF